MSERQSTKRPSHDNLMRAVEYLAAAAHDEMDSYVHLNRAEEINRLMLAVFAAAIRVDAEVAS